MNTKLNVVESVELLSLAELQRMYLFTLGLLSTHEQFSSQTPEQIYTYLRAAFVETIDKESKQ